MASLVDNSSVADINFYRFNKAVDRTLTTMTPVTKTVKNKIHITYYTFLFMFFSHLSLEERWKQNSPR
jgi:hypothetical protein